jgi:hypothetical protein
MTPADPIVIKKGPWGTVEYAVLPDGSAPARTFFEGTTRLEQAKSMALFARLANTGKIQNEQKFKHLGQQDDRKLFEFKPTPQIRYFGEFRPGSRFVVAMAVRKKQQKHRSRDMQMAARILEKSEKGETHARRPH